MVEFMIPNILELYARYSGFIVLPVLTPKHEVSLLVSYGSWST